MKLVHILLASAAIVCAPAFANKDLAQKNSCLACHSVDKKIVGPAFQDIAKKYAAHKDAEAMLISSIKNGGSGKWGPIPMPAQSSLSDADTQTLAAWILSGAK